MWKKFLRWFTYSPVGETRFRYYDKKTGFSLSASFDSRNSDVILPVLEKILEDYFKSEEEKNDHTNRSHENS